jgi:hypothetical protein
MKAKEKAKELFNKYCYAIRTEETDSGYFTNVIYAKQCAVIAVDEIIDSSPMYYTGFEYESNLEYWQEVKQEIEKL